MTQAKAKKSKDEGKEATKQQKAKAQPQPEAKEKEEEKKQGGTTIYTAVAVIIVLVALIAVVFYFIVPGVSGVAFSTFKSNFQSAPRVAVAVTYDNQSQYVSEVPCFTTMLEIIGRSRNASTIDFLLINQTKCLYSPTGLGASASFTTANASSCVQIANNEPGIFLNYSSSNYTRITPTHLYLGADFNYLASCPIAAEFG